MFETKSGVFVIAGLGFFVLAFLVMGLLPWTLRAGGKEQSLEDIARRGILHEFVELAERYPEAFKTHFGDVTEASFAQALKIGHRVYVAEGCWHCHSQQVRQVSNEDRRWGPIAHAGEYDNVLQRPVLFGTRRVGPDLSREGGRRGNDWHVAHFYKPTAVVPLSVMPEYPWLFDGNKVPNQKGMALITYIQWLGSWLDVYPYYHGEGPTAPVTADRSQERDGASTSGEPSRADARG